MKKFLSLVLALVMTMSLVTISAGAKDFTDADKVTYTEAVDVLSAVKVIDGYTDGAFKPTNQLNRGQAAKILCNMILGPTTASALKADAAPFKDVPADSTFAAYIAYCAKEGIIDGYTDGTFRPSAPLTGYAFMKLLLGALGYDKDIEGYNQPNWSINVAKRALSIGLDKGLVETFDGTKIVTREEACLYALNTIKADLVEYGSKTTVNVNGATVTVAGDSAKPMTWDTGVKNDGNIGTADGFIQFAEQYLENLKLNKGATDDFGRPANEWKLKAEKIGTYAKTADLTYTKKVEVGDIYKDLGLNSKVAKANVTVYVDGVKDASQPAVDIKKGDEDNKYGANGVLTEVFYDDKADTVTITEVNTYIGTIVKSVAAKGNKDAYVVIATEAPNGAQQVKDGTRPTTDGTLEFTTDDKFEDDAYVLYTYSQSADSVKSVVEAEKVSGTVTRTENDKYDNDAQKSLVIDGNTYKAAKKVAGESIGNVTVKNDYVIYVDSYGYMIYVEEDEFLSSDYALVLDAANRGSFVGKKAELLFTDGSTKIVTTAKDYSATGTTNLIDTIVTYKVDDDGVYTLKAVSSKQSDGSTNYTVHVPADGDFDMKNDKAGIKVNGGVVNANSATTFVVKDNATVDTYNAFTGIKNAPTIKAQDMDTPADGIQADEKVEVFYFCKNGTMATVMFIMPGTALDVEDDANKTLFLSVESVSNLIHDANSDYFEFDAIVDGKLETVKVADDVKVNGVAVADSAAAKALNGLFKSYSVDKYGVITSLRTYSAYDGTTDTIQMVNGATGIAKPSKEYTVILDTADTATAGGPWTISVDDAAQIYYVDKDGKITESTYKGIAVDENDLVYAIVKDWLVKTLVICEVPADAADDDVYAGNVVTLYKNKYTVDVDGDGDNDLTLKGSSVKVNYIVDNAGRMVMSASYTAPQWVPDGATVTLVIPVNYNKLGLTTITLTGVVDDGEATLNGNSGGIDFRTYNMDKVTLGDVSTETFTNVNVYYFDQTGARLESKLDMTKTDKTLATSGTPDLTARLANTSTGSPTISIVDSSFSGTAATPNYAALNGAAGADLYTTVTATSAKPVVVKINISNLTNLYAITALAATDLNDLGVPASIATTTTLAVAGTPASVEAGASTVVKGTLSANASADSGVYGYKVTVTVGDQTISKVLTTSGATTIGTITVDKDITFSADNVTVEPIYQVAAFKAAGKYTVGVTGTTYTIKLNQAAEAVATTGLTTSDVTTTDTATILSVSVDDDVVTVVTDAAIAASKNLVIAANKLQSVDDTANKNAAITVVLQADGTWQ